MKPTVRVRTEASTLTGARGVVLRSIRWSPSGPDGAVRGRVVLVHGLGEHVGRYRELGAHLASMELAVFGYDQRGHGESKGRRGVLPAFELLLEDLDHVVGRVEREVPGTGPPFLVGHSLGGLVVLRYLQSRRPGLPGAVLVAPWLATALPIPRWKRLARSWLMRLAPDFALPNPMDPDHLTRDPEMQRAFAEDPLVHSRISARLFAEVEAAQTAALEAGPAPEIPLLVLVPGDDPVVEASTTEAYVRSLPGDVTLVRLRGMRHEPFQELDREEVFQRVGSWIRDHLTGQALREPDR